MEFVMRVTRDETEKSADRAFRTVVPGSKKEVK
jgi:hypothetical protein